MDLENFLSNINIIHNSQITNFEEAITFTVENDIDNLSYTVIEKFKPNILERDEDGKYFFDYVLEKPCVDIICDINSNMTTKLWVSGLVLETEDMKIASCCLLYNRICIRIYVEVSEEIYVEFKNILLSKKLRNILMMNDVIFKDMKYHRGIIGLKDKVEC